MDALLLQAQETVRNFIQSLLIKRDAEEAAIFVADDVYVVSASSGKSMQGKHAFFERLILANRNDAPLFTIREEAIEARPLEENTVFVCAVFTAEVTLSNQVEITRRVRLSACVRRQGDKVFISTLHSCASVSSYEWEALFSPTTDWQEQAGHQQTILEKQNELLLQSIPGGIMGCYLEPGFPVSYINSSMLTLLGYKTREEFMRETGGLVSNCIHPEDREYVEKAVDESLSKGDEYDVCYRIAQKSGAYIWLMERGCRVPEGHSRTAFICVCVDVTSRIRLQEEINEKARALEQLTNSIPGGVCEVAMDEAFTLLFGNEPFYSLYGYTPQQMAEELQNQLSLAIHPDDIVHIRTAIQNAFDQGKKPFEFEKRIFRRDGSVAYILTRGAFVWRGEGIVLNCVVIDITERKKMERELKLSEERFRIALSQTHSVLFDFDIPSREVTHSKSAMEIYNLPKTLSYVPESLVTNHIIHEDYTQPFLEMYANIVNGSPTASCVAKVRVASGSYVWNRIVMTAIFNENGEPMRAIGTIEDISKEKEAELLYYKSEQYRNALLAEAILYFEMDLTRDQVKNCRGLRVFRGRRIPLVIARCRNGSLPTSCPPMTAKSIARRSASKACWARWRRGRARSVWNIAAWGAGACPCGWRPLSIFCAIPPPAMSTALSMSKA